MCKIEKDIELCSENTNRGKKPKYPFDQLEPGDSFRVPVGDGAKISGCLTYWNKKLFPAKFVTRKYESDGERVTLNGKPAVRVFREV